MIASKNPSRCLTSRGATTSPNQWNAEAPVRVRKHERRGFGRVSHESDQKPDPRAKITLPIIPAGERWCWYWPDECPDGSICKERDVLAPQHVDCLCCDCPWCTGILLHEGLLAASLAKFRIVRGMQCVDKECGDVVRVLDLEGDLVLVFVQKPGIDPGSVVWRKASDLIPNFGDMVTGGCLRSLAREAWNNVTIEEQQWHDSDGRLVVEVIIWDETRSGHSYFGDSETEAWLEVLKKGSEMDDEKQLANRPVAE